MQITARETRARARAALKIDLQTALVATFLSGIFTTVVQVIEQGFPTYVVYEGMTIRSTSGFAGLLVGLASVLGIVLGPALALGCARFFIERARGGQPPLRTLLALWGIRWRALGLYVCMFLRVIGWAILGAVAAAAVAVGLRIVNLDVLLVVTLVALIPFYWAMLSYTLAPHLMTDAPERTVRDTLDAAKALMADKRGALLKLLLSFAGWYAVLFGVAYLLGRVSSVLASVVTLALGLCLSAYLNAALAAFYVEAARADAGEGERDAEPETL